MARLWMVWIVLLIPVASWGQGREKFSPEMVTFLAGRKEPASYARRQSVEALAAIPHRRNIGVFAEALEANSRDYDRIEAETDKLAEKLTRLRKGRTDTEATEPGSAADVIEGDLFFRRGQLLELEKENSSLRLGLKASVSEVAEPELSEELASLVKRLRTTKGTAARRQWGLTLSLFSRPDTFEALKDLMGHEDPRARADAVDALAGQRRPEAEEVVASALNDPFEIVRAAAIRGLRRLPGPHAVEGLINRVEHEKGRLLEDVVVVLRHLTGVLYHDNVVLWQEWWAKEKPHYRAPGLEGKKVNRRAASGDRRAADADAAFYGLRFQSQALVYLVDTSGSMAEPATAEGGTGTAPIRESKLERAQREVIRSLQGLPSGMRVNIVAYNDALNPFAPGMVDLNDVNRRALIAWVKALRPQGETNIFDPLELVLNEARQKGQKLSKAMIVDTVVLLTDGMPTAGKIRDEELIASEVARLNAVSRIVIHTVGVGPDHARELLRRLSNDSQGIYIAGR